MHSIYLTLDIETQRKVSSMVNSHLSSLNLPREIYISQHDLENLPSSCSIRAKEKLETLESQFGEKLPRHFALALNLSWLSIARTTYSMKISNGTSPKISFNLNDAARKIGSAALLNEMLEEEVECDYSIQLRNSLEISFLPSERDLLDILSIYFYAQASKNIASNSIEDAVNYIHQASLAQEIGSIYTTWDAALKYTEEFIIPHEKLADRSKRARKAALKRISEDPKQMAKREVRKCWEDWQKRPGDYKGKADFARDMLRNFPKLASQPVLERWCREWESNASEQST